MIKIYIPKYVVETIRYPYTKQIYLLSSKVEFGESGGIAEDDCKGVYTINNDKIDII